MEAKKRIGIDGNFTRMLSILVFLLVFAGITRGSSFISVANFQNIAKQLTEYGLMTLGVAIAMISGGIDLSTVYVANLSAICAGPSCSRPRLMGKSQVFFLPVLLLW